MEAVFIYLYVCLVLFVLIIFIIFDSLCLLLLAVLRIRHFTVAGHSVLF